MYKLNTYYRIHINSRNNHTIRRKPREKYGVRLEVAREAGKNNGEVKAGYEKVRVDGKWIEWTDGAKGRSSDGRFQVFDKTVEQEQRQTEKRE